ncbi:MAG TPA: MASE1 domain-containing protein, partial [Clostridia bacterium]|nr:MASE1 domain-containing protein [Clostridia bacterium]
MAVLSRHALQTVAVAGLYALAGVLGLLTGVNERPLVIIWPPAGLALGLLLIAGNRVLPGLLLGAIGFGVAVSWNASTQFPLGMLSGALLGVGHVLAAILGAHLTRRYANGAAALEQTQTVLVFVALGVLTSTAVGATITTSAIVLAQPVLWSESVTIWIFRWLASMVGALALAPALMAWKTADAPLPPPSSKRRVELVLMLVLLTLICVIAFTDWIIDLTGTPVSFLVLPIPLWVAFRFGRRGTTGVILIIVTVAIACTLAGQGPFHSTSFPTSLVLLQNFIAVLIVITLILSADVSQRQFMEAHLRSSEQRYRALFETNPMPMWVFNCDSLRFLAVNQAAIDHYGYSREEFLGMTIANLLPAEDAVQAQAHGSSRQTSSTQHLRHRKKDGTVIEVETIAHNIFFYEQRAAVVLSNDVTRRNLDERHLAALSELGKRLSAARTTRQAGLILAEIADRLFGWDACLLDVRTRDSEELVTILCFDTVDGRKVEFQPDAVPLGPALHPVIHQGAPLLIHGNGQSFSRFGDTSRPSACLMFVPILREGRTLGVFSIQSYTPNAYAREDLTTLQTLVDHCTGALERIRVEADLEGQLAERRKAEQEVLRLNAELERRVVDRTAQLEATNKELEAFAYSVSHDLRAPLRSIRGFSEVLLERYTSQLDARGQEFLRRTCQSSHQMDRLIEDLLKFSRVSRSELHRLPVDLSALALAITEELRKSAPERSVEIVIAPGIQALGDERLLRIVLDNLLRNAWKFTSKQAHAKIEFDRAEQSEPAFYVRDNGAGFDMNYATKMFGVFQRLHTASEFPGTGIGLATVQRIINRHGGRIWA